LASVRESEAAPVVWGTSRTEEVILARQDAQSGGLTIASWDETSTLRVSVIASGEVSLNQVKTAVESAEVRVRSVA
jgi:isocitrate lyase